MAPAGLFVRGGRLNSNEWHYRQDTEVFTRYWAAQYPDVYYNGYEYRLVMWYCEDVSPVQRDGKTFYKEVWRWYYTDYN